MTKWVLALFLIASPAFAQDDCPPGHVRNPAVSPLDHDYMLSAYKASFRGIFGREPSMQHGAGVDDGEYYIAAADHFGVYGDDQCHAGWSGYWESWLEVGHGDLTRVQTPARFLPNVTPTQPPTPPVITPNPPQSQLDVIADRLQYLGEQIERLSMGQITLNDRVTALEAKKIPATCKASVWGYAVSCTLQ